MSTTDEKAIRDLMAGMTQALRDRDAEALRALYADDAVTYDLAPPLQTRAADTYIDGVRKWFNDWRTPIELETRDVKLHVGDDVAFSTGLSHMRGTKVDGEVDIWSRATFGYRKIGGSWKIVHEHSSVPFYMDGSMKASIDLKP